LKNPIGVWVIKFEEGYSFDFYISRIDVKISIISRKKIME